MFRQLVFATGFLLTFLAIAPARAVEKLSYTEDFTTREYEDAGGTSANWDIEAGQLRLNPYSPTVLASYATNSIARVVEWQGSRAFVGSDYLGLQIIDSRTPRKPALLGQFQTEGNVRAIVAVGTRVYLTDEASFKVIDISYPSVPWMMGNWEPPAQVRGLAVDGDLAFVAATSAGLQLVDLSDPTAPVLAGSLMLPGEARDVALANGLAYVACGDAGLSVVDIADPGQPVLLGSCDTPGLAVGLAVAGKYACVADTEGGLQVVDVGDVSHPVLVGALDTPGPAYDVAVRGTRAYLACTTGGLQIVDISNPAAPVSTGSFERTGTAYGVDTSGNRAVVAYGASGLHFVQISDPVTPSPVGAIQTGNTVTGVRVIGDFAYLSESPSGLRVLDISEQTDPKEVGVLDQRADANAIEVVGSYAYLTSRSNGFLVVDLSRPATPKVLGTLEPNRPAYSVAVAGNLALVNRGEEGLSLVDIRDRRHPTLLRDYRTQGIPYTLAISGDYAYVADGPNGLLVLDIGNPIDPKPVGSLSTPSATWGVAVDGNVLVVTDRLAGLMVVDITRPNDPQLLSTQEIDGNDNGAVRLAGNLAYVTAYKGKLRIFDISDPFQPALIGAYDQLFGSWQVDVSGDFTFAADDWGGFKVVRCLQGELNLQRNRGRSLPIDGSDDVIIAARLRAEQTGDVSWELGTYYGAYHSVLPDGQWNFFEIATSRLFWRATLSWEGTNPSVSQLTVDWLKHFPVIQSAADIPKDEGRQLRLRWRRSGHDLPGADNPITQYAVYRKIDPGLGILEAKQSDLATRSDLRRTVREHAQRMLAAGWDFLVSVPARLEDDYSVVVPTLADSSLTSGQHYTTFMVSALTATPGIFFDSRPDSGYSVDNLAPGMPQNLTAQRSQNGIRLEWSEVKEPDFLCFRVYRDEDPGFTPSASNRVAEILATNWTDTNTNPGSIFYKLTALDRSGNESEAAAFAIEAAVPSREPVSRFALYDAVPNPFNPSTTLSFELPVRARVRLSIYDQSGRLIRTLLDGVEETGRHEVNWGGTDQSGASVASGVYLYRIEAGSFEQTKRMVLLK